MNDIVANRLLSRTDSEWSPRLGLIFKPVEAMSFYASYTKTFLPRSGDQFLSLTPAQATLAPESFDNYEFGAKWDIAENLRVSAAIFQLDRENGVVVDPANPANSIITGSRTRGFEAQFTGQILPGWQSTPGTAISMPMSAAGSSQAWSTTAASARSRATWRACGTAMT